MKGCFTAIVTPFKEGLVDYDSLARIVDIQARAGIDGIIPCGTTGEAPTLSHEEHDKVIEFVIREAKGKLKVIAGAGSNATKECLRLSTHADQAGAEAILIVSPYYNKPTQEGLYQHYKTIADAISCEIIIYNIPGRTGINIEVDTFKRLVTDCKNITTVKEATGNVDFANTLKNKIPALDLISGNDSLNLPLASIGAVGCISVVANIFPASVKRIFTLYNEGKVAEAAKLHHRFLPLIEILFSETNPIPIKAACQHHGIITSAQLRLPLVPISESLCGQLTTTLAELSDLS